MDMAGKRINEHEDMSKETSQIENRINIKKPTERQVICKLQKNKDQEKSLKEAKRKKTPELLKNYSILLIRNQANKKRRVKYLKC